MQHFITRFQHFITENNLFVKGDKILLAVSGGVDSVVMSYLFFLSKFNFGIAHCNFQLRGEASASDEEFVKQLAEKFRVPFYSTRFQTQEYAEVNKVSIQMAARDLRYDWLESIRQQNDFQWIATAHHLNDSIETFFYNFAKGTGIRGLHGIPIKNNYIIRPLSFANKQEVLNFSQEYDLLYRIDASNEKDIYARNHIRHHIVPLFKALNPNFENTAAKNLQHIREIESLYDYAIQHLRQQIVLEKEHQKEIDLLKLADYPFAISTLLYEYLHPLGFNANQIAQMRSSEVGALFYTATHKLLVDRTRLIIENLDITSQQETFVIPIGTQRFDTNVGFLTFEYKTGYPKALLNDPFVVYLDAEKLTFPLTLRHWQAGDSFYPLGLRGNSQKLQDFFSNRKLSRFEKESVWLLESGDAICWVIGHRLDERFKITEQTQNYYIIQFRKS